MSNFWPNDSNTRKGARLTMVMPAETRARLDVAAEQSGLSLADLARQMVEHCLDEMDAQRGGDGQQADDRR